MFGRHLSSFTPEEVDAFRASAEFDEMWYVREYPDVAQVGIDPALHYLWIGRHLGRMSCAPQINGTVQPSIFDRQARYRIDRALPIIPGKDWLIFVAYTADGALSDCQKFQISQFVSAGYEVALVINTPAMTDLVDHQCLDARIVIVRENIGFDFGAWRHAVEIFGGLSLARSVSFTNDSILHVGDDASVLASMREEICASIYDIVFLTENKEVRPHCQSYFFTMNSRALACNSLDHIANVPLYREKDDLIGSVEVYLSDRLRDAGSAVGHLYRLEVEENPTIHHWEALLDCGFPFIKVQLITAGILDLEDARLSQRLNPEILEMLRAHCTSRALSPATPMVTDPIMPRRAIPIDGLFNEYGAQQAINPSPNLFPPIRIPLIGIADTPVRVPRILAIIHGFYVDLLPTIFSQIASWDVNIRIVVTTDTSAKVERIDELILLHGLDGQAVLCPNRGRDVAPFLIEGAKHLHDAEVILHLHTKKSPHDSVYAGWGDFLYSNLIASADIALSILHMLDQSNLGIIYSDHFYAVNGLRNWGYDFTHASNLLARIGCKITADTPLEFPTSTMFWARRAALEPLFELGLTYEDFEPEEGQIDGTLAHAIERSLLYVCEHAGFGHAKVTARDTATDPHASLVRLRADSVRYALERPMPRLNGGLTLRNEFYDSVPEIYPVGVANSANRRPRLNAILPTMKPEKIYGGITTALSVIRNIVDNMAEEPDIRVLVTSDSVDHASVEALSSRLGRSFIVANPQDDVDCHSIVQIANATHNPVSLREGDMYISTAWWTADLGFRLLDEQRRMFAVDPLMTYIIQDFEPGFYNWSNHYALADATYRRPNETIAIFNSEELASYMWSRYRFSSEAYIAFELHPVLRDLIKPTMPEKMILAYGRPTVSRNCFELLREGVRVWQGRNPQANCEYEIVFAGESFDQGRLSGLQNARNAGKVSLHEYADMLNRACAGVSLMVSPHPSYPPMEMASAGCQTITNVYEGKDLSRRSDQIVSLETMTPSALADALDLAVSKVNFGAPKLVHRLNSLKIDMPPVEYRKIAATMLKRAHSPR